MENTNAVPFQLCPKCGGSSLMSQRYPPIKPSKCDVCEGAMVIPMAVVPHDFKHDLLFDSYAGFYGDMKRYYGGRCQAQHQGWVEKMNAHYREELKKTKPGKKKFTFSMGGRSFEIITDAELKSVMGGFSSLKKQLGDHSEITVIRYEGIEEKPEVKSEPETKIRDIPSSEFKTTDEMAKLNEALGTEIKNKRAFDFFVLGQCYTIVSASESANNHIREILKEKGILT